MVVNDIKTSLMFASKINYNTQNSLETTMERISTGSRLARVMDDPSGLAISKGFQSSIRGQNIAIQNIEDGISVCRLQHAGLQEVQDILLRMRDIALRASNDAVMTTADLERFKNEYNTLQKELDRFTETAEYNTIPILKGDPKGTASSDLEFELKWYTDQTDVDMHVLQPDGAHAWYFDQDPSGHGVIDIDDVNGISPPGTNPATEHYNVAPGVALTGNYDLWINYYYDDGNGSELVTVTISMYRGTEFENITTFDVNVPYQNWDDPYPADYDGDSFNDVAPFGEVFVGSYYWEPLPEYVEMELQIGAQDKDFFHYAFMYPNTSIKSVGLKGVTLDNTSAIRAAVTKLDESLETVSNHMALVGIRESTLRHVINDMATGNINMAAANSRIEDADLALELTNLAKTQLMMQTATDARAMYSNALYQNAAAIVELIK